MSLENCATLTTLSLTCDAAKDPSGVRGLVWLGFRPEISSCSFGMEGDITAFTTSGGLYTFDSKHRVHAPKTTGIPGEKIQMFDQEIMLHLFAKSKSERAAMEILWKSERMIIFFQTEGGQVMAGGIDIQPSTGDLDDERGLKGSAYEKVFGGATVNEDMGYKITLKGTFYSDFKLVTSITVGNESLTEIIADLNSLT